METKWQTVKRVVRYAFGHGETRALVGRAASVAVSAGVLATLAGWLGGWPAALVVLVLTAVAGSALIAAYRLAADLARHEGAARPYLVFTGTEVAPAAVVARSMDFAASPAATANPGYVLATTETYTFARVRVANDPPPEHRGLRAERVAARIAFIAEDGRTLLEMDGRWSETPQQAERGILGQSLEGAQLDIDANAITHPIDIAMKRPGESDFFAYNDENAQGDRLGLDKHRLGGEQVRVRVTLRPANGERVIQDFVLRNGGQARTLDIDFAP